MAHELSGPGKEAAAVAFPNGHDVPIKLLSKLLRLFP